MRNSFLKQVLRMTWLKNRSIWIRGYCQFLYRRLNSDVSLNHYHQLSLNPSDSIALCETITRPKSLWGGYVYRYCHSHITTDVCNVNQTDEAAKRKTGHDNEETDLVEVSSDILVAVRELDVTLYSVSVADVKRNLESLVSLGGTVKDWQALMKKSPAIAKCKELDAVLNLLSELGFSWNMILEILDGYSAILKRDQAKLKGTIEYLKNTFRNEQKMNSAIIANPGILSADSDYISARLDVLREWFKQSDVLSLVYKCPSVLFDDITELQEKYEYVHQVMGISQRQILYSQLFAHSLLHIQARHMFLVRAGLFKRMQKDKGQIDSNPKLQEIIDTNDKKFASKFGGMSEQDYICFVQYFQREKERSELDE